MFKDREVNRLKNKIESLESSLDYEVSQNSVLRDNKIDIQKELQNTKAGIANLEASTDATVKKAESDAIIKIAEARSAAEISISTATRKAKDEYADKFLEIKDEVIELNVKAERADAKAEERLTVVDGLRKEVEGYKKLITELAAELPKVDLSKFNVNVDVPAQEVTVNTK